MEETRLKRNIPCQIEIENQRFEAKLLPKGNGYYYIPINKKIISKLDEKCEYDISFTPINQLSRINHDSLYSKEKPIRKIDGIKEIPIKKGFCGHCCLAMLAGVELDEILKVMGRESASWSKIIETLDYYGLSYNSKISYPRRDDYLLPACCIIYNDGGFVLYYQNKYYGRDQIDPNKTISYLEIIP